MRAGGMVPAKVRPTESFALTVTGESGTTGEPNARRRAREIAALAAEHLGKHPGPIQLCEPCADAIVAVLLAYAAGAPS